MLRGRLSRREQLLRRVERARWSADSAARRTAYRRRNSVASARRRLDRAARIRAAESMLRRPTHDEHRGQLPTSCKTPRRTCRRRHDDLAVIVVDDSRTCRRRQAARSVRRLAAAGGRSDETASRHSVSIRPAQGDCRRRAAAGPHFDHLRARRDVAAQMGANEVGPRRQRLELEAPVSIGDRERRCRADRRDHRAPDRSAGSSWTTPWMRARRSAAIAASWTDGLRRLCARARPEARPRSARAPTAATILLHLPVMSCSSAPPRSPYPALPWSRRLTIRRP